MKKVSITVTLFIISFFSYFANAQSAEGNHHNIELKTISPIEKVGYKKLEGSHWVSYTDIIIDATPEQVWSVLTDEQSYPNWNEIIIKMEGEIVDKGTLDVTFKNGVDAKPKVYHHPNIHVEDRVEFYWSNIEIMGIRDRHCFRVKATNDGKTRFIQSDESIKGITWLLGKTVVKAQIDLYPTFNKSLKAEVEKRFPKI